MKARASVIRNGSKAVSFSTPPGVICYPGLIEAYNNKSNVVFVSTNPQKCRFHWVKS